MNININLGNTQENITSEIILKLYQIATAADNTVTLSGNLYSPSGYAYQVDYLNTQFAPNLTITVPDAGKYIYFEDSVVEDILKSNGFSTDGIGISTTDALQKISIPSNLFSGRTDITTFRELSYFRNLLQIGGSAFYGCTNLETISLPLSLVNIQPLAFRNAKLTDLDINLPALTNLSWGAFRNTNIKKVSNLGSITTLGDNVFNSCTSLVSINLPVTCTTIGKEGFTWCSQLEDINVENIVTIGANNFFGCQKLTKPLHFKSLESVDLNAAGHLTCTGCLYMYLPKLINGCGGYDRGGNNIRGMFVRDGWSVDRSPFNILYFKDLTTLKTGMFSGCTIRNLIINNQTPPSVTVFNSDKQTTLFTPDSSTQVLNIYVPDDSVDSYKNASYWSELASKYKPISSLNKVATVELFNALPDETKVDTLIEEYM